MEKEGEHPYCESCGKKSHLVPMRFMAVCEGGHLTDIPWDKWAHIGTRSNCNNHRLQFKSDPKRGAGLQSLVVACLNCKSENAKPPRRNSRIQAWTDSPDFVLDFVLRLPRGGSLGPAKRAI